MPVIRLKFETMCLLDVFNNLSIESKQIDNYQLNFCWVNLSQSQKCWTSSWFHKLSHHK